MDFERAWLSYRKRTDDLNGRYFAVVYGDFADPVVKTAVREIGRAATEILNVETERKSGTLPEDPEEFCMEALPVFGIFRQDAA